ncbi:hypothetical protein LJR016_002430 [Devosia sp. LjRoot16]|uniref:hypothetical protein n=1 Tax=Devosia sp. LjRoot16 TaxID=3342271 RepID=UPI003ECD28F4
MPTVAVPSRDVPVATPKQIRLATLLLFVYWIGVYSGFSILGSDGGLIVPFAIANGAGLVGIALYLQFLPQPKIVLGWVAALLLIVAASAVTSVFTVANSWPRLLACAQISLSIVSGVGAVCVMMAAGRNGMSRTFRAITAIIFFASLIEIFAPREFVLLVYENLYAWRPVAIYDAIARDEALWGWVRPLGLSTEPSFVGIFLGLLTLADNIVTDGTSRQRSLLQLLVLFACYFAVVRSVTLFIFLLLVLLRYLSPQRGNLLASITTICVCAAGASLLAYALNETGFLGGGSVFIRLVAPYAAALDAISELPVFGFGIGSESDVYPIISSVWSRLDAWSNFSYYYGSPSERLITSNIAWMLIYLGIGGAAALLFCIHGFCSALAKSDASWTVVAILLVWTSIGGFADARTWSIVFILASAAAINKHPPTAEPRS